MLAVVVIIILCVLAVVVIIILRFGNGQFEHIVGGCGKFPDTHWLLDLAVDVSQDLANYRVSHVHIITLVEKVVTSLNIHRNVDNKLVLRILRRSDRNQIDKPQIELPFFDIRAEVLLFLLQDFVKVEIRQQQDAKLFRATLVDLGDERAELYDF